MPREFGVPKHPLFFLGPLLPHKWQRDQTQTEKANLLGKFDNTTERTFHDNQDVAQERFKVQKRAARTIFRIFSSRYYTRISLVEHRL